MLPVFWYNANRITVPPAGNESISLNIDRTRPLRYKIEMSRVDTTFVDGKVPIASTTTATAGFNTNNGCDPPSGSAGSLPAGNDDINATLDPSMSNITWGP